MTHTTLTKIQFFLKASINETKLANKMKKKKKLAMSHLVLETR